MCEPPFATSVTLLIQLLRNLVEPEWTADTVCALAGLCATLPRTCYTTTFADSVAAATMSKAQFRRQASHYRPNTAPRRPPNQHWQLGFPGDDLEAMRSFCDQVDQQVQALLA